MSNEPPKSRLAHLPSILAGTAAVIAAASTLYVNLREDAAPEPASTSVVARPAPVAPATDKIASIQPQRMVLRLDRVQVDNDGSAGDTDWTFQVSVDGDPLFSLAMPSLSDRPGENLARPEDAQDASGEVLLPAGKSVALNVNGWRKRGWLPGSRAEVTGQAWLASGFNKSTVTLKADPPEAARLVLYFSAVPVK